MRVSDMRAWDYPKPIVRIKCNECKREGQYTKYTFVTRVGPHTQLPDALRIIASDCPKNHPDNATLTNPCKTYYPDLC